MNFGYLILTTIIGLSTTTISYFVVSPTIERWQMKQMRKEKLKVIKEALEEANERVERLENRHERILSQLCGYYLTHPELEEAVVEARNAVKEALVVTSTLTKMQIHLINSLSTDYYHNIDL
ncbi:hypothetical protein CsatA_008466 [Cannabis sativa]